MADTKKGGSGGGNSIVWSWREVDVRNCTCMSVEAGMYCGTIQVPDGEPPITGSCGTHCWDLGYVDAATGYFISKGFPLCGGPDAPPLPDPILWPEFPLINDANKDGVPPCQQRATRAAFMQQAGLQSELQQVVFENAVIQEPVIRTDFPPEEALVLKHRTIIHYNCGSGIESCPCSTQVGGGTQHGCPTGKVCISVQFYSKDGSLHNTNAGCATIGQTGTIGNEPFQKWLRLNEQNGWGLWDGSGHDGWVTPTPHA